MKLRGGLIIVFVLILLAVVYFTIQSPQTTNKLTGKEVLIDEGFTKPASDFLGKNKLQLSPPARSSCVLDKVSWSKTFASLQDTITLEIQGNNCNGKRAYVDFFEKDPLSKEKISSSDVLFINDIAYVNLAIDEKFFELFDGFFEGELEVIAEIFVSRESKLVTPIVYVNSGEDILLQVADSDPILDRLEPNVTQNDVQRTVRMYGSNLNSDFEINLDGGHYCYSADISYCRWINFTAVEFDVAEGATPADYNFSLRNADMSLFPPTITWSNFSNEVTLTVQSVPVTPPTPFIEAITPSTIVNDVNNTVLLTGTGLEEHFGILVRIAGDPNSTIPFCSFVQPDCLWINDTAISFVIGNYNGPGDFEFQVVNADGTPRFSNFYGVTINEPFDYSMQLNPSSSFITSGSSLIVNATISQTSSFMTPENVTLSILSPIEFTTSFIGPDNCRPEPICTISLNVMAATVASTEYTLSVNGLSSGGLPRQALLTLTGVGVGQPTECENGVQDPNEACIDGGGACTALGFLCDIGETCLVNTDCVVTGLGQLCYAGTGLGGGGDPTAFCASDIDGDAVPDGIDVCPATVNGTTVGPLNGCPIPIRTKFTTPPTTNFLSVLDLTRVQDMVIGTNLGEIIYAGQQVSVLRNNSGVYSAISLDDSVNISDNLISVDSTSYPELSQSSQIKIYNLTYSVEPTLMVSNGGAYTACPASICSLRSYSGGTYAATVSGFSSYTTQQASCNDNYCNPSESCSTCAADCGACPAATPGPSGGGGGGGGGGGAPKATTLVTQCNNKIDDDNDGKIDFPLDTGCTNSNDNIELNVEALITTPTTGEETSEENTTASDKDLQISIFFWVVLGILGGGIIVAVVMIVRSMGRRKKFDELAQIANNEDNAETDSSPIVNKKQVK